MPLVSLTTGAVTSLVHNVTRWYSEDLISSVVVLWSLSNIKPMVHYFNSGNSWQTASLEEQNTRSYCRLHVRSNHVISFKSSKCSSSGFYHEQSRPDRDNYVRLVESNIKEGQKGKSPIIVSVTQLWQKPYQKTIWDIFSLSTYTSLSMIIRIIYF